MLVVQEIVSVWYKSERGGENSEVRSRFPYTANIERKPGVDDECVFDHVRFYQSKNKFYCRFVNDIGQNFLKIQQEKASRGDAWDGCWSGEDVWQADRLNHRRNKSCDKNKTYCDPHDVNALLSRYGGEYRDG